MARPLLLNDIDKVKEAVTKFKEDPKPTKAGLLRLLGVKSEKTLYTAMDKDNDISDILFDAWLYIVECHEKGLYEKACTGHIYFLKTLSKYIKYKEYDTVVADNASKDITINIIPNKDT